MTVKKYKYLDYQRKWNRQNRVKQLLKLYGKDKLIQCQVCKQWYRQIGSHVVAIHGFSSAREYRIEYGFDVRRGQLPFDYRKYKAELVFYNRTVDNLQKGAPYVFKKGTSIPRYKRSKETLERLKSQFKS